jgi:hypothetical protein
MYYSPVALPERPDVITRKCRTRWLEKRVQFVVNCFDDTGSASSKWPVLRLDLGEDSARGQDM